MIARGNSSVGRASAFQAEGRGFDSRFPLSACLNRSVEHPDLKVGTVAGSPVGTPLGESRFPLSAYIAQSVEHFLGKEEVTGSSPVVGSQGVAGSVGGRTRRAARTVAGVFIGS